MTDAIDLRIDPRVRPVGGGQVRRLLPYRTRRMVGPFIYADIIGPETIAPGSSFENTGPSFEHADATAVPDNQVGRSSVRVAVGSGWGLHSPVAGSGTAIVLGGEPVGQRTIWWNFVHSGPDRIEQARGDWTMQRFPRVPRDHHPYVPLPR